MTMSNPFITTQNFLSRQIFFFVFLKLSLLSDDFIGAAREIAIIYMEEFQIQAMETSPYPHDQWYFEGCVAPPRKLFSNCTKVSLRTTHVWRIKFKRVNEKRSSEHVVHFPF